MPEERGTPWSPSEIETAVESYFRMLRAELADEPYVKARENEVVRERTGRSKGSVEFKFQNISAVLMELGAGRFIRGYLPRVNVQQALRDAVAERWRQESDIEELMRAAVDRPLDTPRADLQWTVEDPPKFTVAPDLTRRRRTPIRTDFLALELARRDLGLAGERAVVEFEQRRLRRQGHDTLARRVEHVSQTQGDGLGFDVLSFDGHGREKFIEVKTTRNQREFPFIATRNEVDFSREEHDRFHLYRVFDFRADTAKLFTLSGPMDETCLLEPASFTAYPSL